MTTLAEASLSTVERETLDRFVELLGRELGDELVSVWLYGSRARGEATGPDSDVDVMVLTRGDPDRGRSRAARAMEAAAGAVGANELFFSVRVRDLEWLADRRAIEAFFVDELERDRIVIAGDGEGDEPPPLRAYAGMRPRTRELLDQANEWLSDATVVVDAGGGSSAISTAYYATFYAARAALSERDLSVRSHTGLWDLFRRTFVEGGEFDDRLARAAAAVQEPREDADYRARRFSRDEAEEILALAARFVTAVEEMIGE